MFTASNADASSTISCAAFARPARARREDDDDEDARDARDAARTREDSPGRASDARARTTDDGQRACANIERQRVTWRFDG